MAPQHLCAALRMWEVARGAERMGRENPQEGGRKGTVQELELGQGPGRESMVWVMTGKGRLQGRAKKPREGDWRLQVQCRMCEKVWCVTGSLMVVSDGRVYL